MKNIMIQCDRCCKLIEGGIGDNGMTAGYYDLTDGYWKQFARWEENYICDKCMHSDPKYIAIYGLSNVVK